MEKTLKIQDLRRDYKFKSLDISDCDPSPFIQFQTWFNEAVQSACDEPNAFVLSTVNSQGRPRSRTVLLKGFNQESFHFYSNYESAKGHELKTSPYVSMTFLWLPLERQIRIEGIAKKMTHDESEKYFQSRPRGSQLGAIASRQSEKVASKEILAEQFKSAEEKWKNTDAIPCPDYWGGYQIIPSYFEFWQGQSNRLHDRIEYELKDTAWIRSRLSP